MARKHMNKDEGSAGAQSLMAAARVKRRAPAVAGAWAVAFWLHLCPQLGRQGINDAVVVGRARREAGSHWCAVGLDVVAICLAVLLAVKFSLPWYWLPAAGMPGLVARLVLTYAAIRRACHAVEVST